MHLNIYIVSVSTEIYRMHSGLLLRFQFTFVLFCLLLNEIQTLHQ